MAMMMNSKKGLREIIYAWLRFIVVSRPIRDLRFERQKGDFR